MEKICLACGRSFSWRKKWEDDWENIKFCSKSCRGANLKKNEKIKEEILLLLDKRSRGSSICPSEVLNAELKNDKTAMEEVRRAARLLVAEGKIEITQKGRVVDPSSFKGPIRLRKSQGG